MQGRGHFIGLYLKILEFSEPGQGCELKIDRLWHPDVNLLLIQRRPLEFVLKSVKKWGLRLFV
jgi:hypothetical protein